MILKQLLEQISSELAIPTPEEGADNLFTLNINEELAIRLGSEKEFTFFQSPIDICPQQGKEDLFIYLMKANLLGQGTGKSKIGLSEDDKFLTLTRVIPYEMNYKEFKDEVEDFTNYLLYWKQEIARLKEEKEKSLY